MMQIDGLRGISKMDINIFYNYEDSTTSHRGIVAMLRDRLTFAYKA